MLKTHTKDHDTSLPTLHEALQSYTLALSPKQTYAKKILKQLSEHQPQVIIFEGGTADERLSTALWYTAKLNCKEKKPCLNCSSCLQIGAKIFSDLYILNGAQESIKIDDIRGLHHIMSKPPCGNGKKVFIFSEAQYLRVEAANALLKIFEEPHIENCFLLLIPQREQLLPTIISRALTVRLAYTQKKISLEPIIAQWEETLAIFLSTGKEWFNLPIDKNTNVEVVRQFILSLRKSLISTITKQIKTNIEQCFSIIPEAGILYIQDVLNQAEESLTLMVNPSLVLNWIATKVYLAHYKAKKLSSM